MMKKESVKYLKKTFYFSDGKHEGRIKKWGTILDRKEGNFIVYLSINPQGWKIRYENEESVKKWIDNGDIFIKELK